MNSSQAKLSSKCEYQWGYSIQCHDSSMTIYFRGCAGSELFSYFHTGIVIVVECLVSFSPATRNQLISYERNFLCFQ